MTFRSFSSILIHLKFYAVGDKGKCTCNSKWTIQSTDKRQKSECVEHESPHDQIACDHQSG